jgi:hypothetical protein
VQLSGYAPVGGESYTLLTANSVVSGATQNVDLTMAQLSAGLSWEVNIGATSVVLRVLGGTGGRAGDFDLDGDVDGGDFLVWQRGLGTQFDAGDLADWRMNYGTGGANASAGAVPEPMSQGLIVVASLALGLARRKRKSS